MKRKFFAFLMCVLLASIVTACGTDKEAITKSDVTISESVLQNDESIIEKEKGKDAVITEHVATYSVALGASFLISVPNSESIEEISFSDEAILEMITNKLYVAKSCGTTTVLIDTSQEHRYEFTINVFDQQAVFSPDYRGINADNYLRRLQEVKQKKDEVLKCDRIYFMLDFYDGDRIDGGSPANFDVNLFDLIDGVVHLTIKATAVTGADWYSCGLGTNWEDCGSYLNLERFEHYFNEGQGDFEYTFLIDEKTADEIREYGRLWLTGNGYLLHSATIYGTPIAEYDGMTASELSPVVKNGGVHMDGTNVVNEKGETVRLLGAAFAWNMLELQYGNSKTYAYFNETWGGNTVRIGEHAETEGGYASVAETLDDSYERGNQKEILYYIETMIDACIESGMYAIVDWHVFFNPLTYADYAVDYFDIISKKYAGVPNVIYEICNEPCDDDKTSVREDSWENVKSYANMVIPVIRANSPDALIVCGGPSWSNDILVRANDPLKYDNVIYTDHIYSWHTHFADEKSAYQKGIGLLITECSPDMNDVAITPQSAENFRKWEEIWNQNNTGFFFWSLDNGAGDGGLKKEVVKRYGWTEDDYTPLGLYMYHMMRRAAGLE